PVNEVHLNPDQTIKETRAPAQNASEFKKAAQRRLTRQLAGQPPHLDISARWLTSSSLSDMPNRNEKLICWRKMSECQT
ncbi:hypothetical protein, partial [Massilia sp. TWR1-2-2]|uniref:hypothetical protein n=1 Tax=Massilia sp. TWR1-2-2 TaxID=2804584 RepID=UPI003CEA240C